MNMIKKIIVLQIFVALLFFGCSFKNKKVQVDLRVPEALVVTTSETANKIKKLQEENTVESNELAEKIFRERRIIEDEKVIRKIFDELNSLQGEIVENKDKGKINGNYLFSFDLIDDKEKGLDGNDYSKDLRYIAVIKEDTIVIPMLYGNNEAGLSEKSIYFVKVKINKEFYELLKALTEKCDFYSGKSFKKVPDYKPELRLEDKKQLRLKFGFTKKYSKNISEMGRIC